MKKRQKDCKSQRWRITPGNIVSQTQHNWYTWIHRSCAAHRTCTSSGQIRSQHWEREADEDPKPNQEDICNWHSRAKERYQFSPGESPWVYWPHFRVGLIASCDEQHKTNSTVSLETLSHFVFFGHFLSYWSLARIFWFLFLYFCHGGGSISSLYLVAFVCFLEGGMELSREVGRIWEELGKGKSMVMIHCKKKINKK